MRVEIGKNLTILLVVVCLCVLGSAFVLNGKAELLSQIIGGVVACVAFLACMYMIVKD